MSDNQLGVLLEDIQSKLQALAEAISVIQQDISEIKIQIAPIPKMAADIEAIKAVQVDQGQHLRYHETYLVSQGMPARA